MKPQAASFKKRNKGYFKFCNFCKSLTTHNLLWHYKKDIDAKKVSWIIPGLQFKLLYQQQQADFSQKIVF